MKCPRFLHRWYACLMGYFWLPCPLCREYFGGHEWTNWQQGHGVPDPHTPGVKHGICNACATKAIDEVLAAKRAMDGADMIIIDEAGEVTPEQWDTLSLKNNRENKS